MLVRALFRITETFPVQSKNPVTLRINKAHLDGSFEFVIQLSVEPADELMCITATSRTVHCGFETPKVALNYASFRLYLIIMIFADFVLFAFE